MMLQIRNLTDKLVNFEYGEGKSCTESSIIGMKSYYTANYLKLVVSIRDFIV